VPAVEPIRVDSEPALDAALPILDAHIHLWPVGDEAPFSKPYLLPDLMADTTAGHQVSGTVYVECSSNYRQDGPEHLRPVGETEWLRALIDRENHTGIIRAIVGYADLSTSELIGKVMDGHRSAVGSLFKGVRCGAAWDPSPLIRNAAHDPPPGLLSTDNAQRAVRGLGYRDLTFDTWVYFHQLDEVSDLARKCPGTQIVLDHLGGPAGAGPYAGRRDEVLREWRKGLARVARHENVALKLGGIGFPPFLEPGAGLVGASSEALAAYWRSELLYCIETFGANRCMFEANWPVDSVLCDYVTLWNVFKRATKALTATERQALFHDTAMAIYRIDQ
jgi:predicted TIM-barrel fold metal-dependent hydrolase